MWTRHKNHMVWTEPWVYVALPNQEVEYFQMHEPKDEPRPERWLVQMTRAWC